jgi:hypothetical protein
VQNIAQTPFSFESVAFEPAEGMECIDANVQPNSLALLSPQDIRQYLFIIKPASAKVMAGALRQGQLSLGKLNIIWLGPTGEQGRLTTAQLTRKISPPPLLSAFVPSAQEAFHFELLLDDQPEPVRPHEPLTLHFTILIKPLRQLEGQRAPLQLAVQHVDFAAMPKVEADLASAIGKTPGVGSSGRSTPGPPQQASFPPPVPFHKSNSDPSSLPSPTLMHLGEGLVHLPPVDLPESWWQPSFRPRAFSVASSVDSRPSLEGQPSDFAATEEPVALSFSMRYCLTSPGLANIGGLRVLAVDGGTPRRVADYESVATVLARA